ncbi:diguanylate cyclase/phosphodiesterase [Halalkalibacter wakoensis JCM 9140]|uniref:Diguanylate cyclase/phosphodiesterase n=1 Tax=Halalkalibacter wakoensis JCM 9140 TaxID=1236970 RepID=W4PZH6_9BACI|nr:GGDEF domain-containing protein [Halalkalibacter wakoensis]GAE25142.1 diguanylate cyclase/phosphodiesterase [Halalkalibacter wakoensis JCM 9140]
MNENTKIDQNQPNQWQHIIVKMLADNDTLESILIEIASLVEAYMPTAICSIQLLDQTKNRLEKPVALNLKEDYKEAVGGVKPGPRSGSCGTAIFKKETIIVSDIETNVLWDDFRELALDYGLRSCWSVPIFSPTKKVLGTFALYFYSKKEPSLKELNELNQFGQLAGIAIDYKQSKEEVLTIRSIDSLTGLVNGNQFKLAAKEMLKKSRTLNEAVAFIFIDLNRFNLINNIGGYSAGDNVLKEVTSRLQQVSPTPFPLLTRWNSDKFILALPGISKHSMPSYSEKIIELLSAPFKCHDHEFIVTTSIGVSCFPDDAEDVDELIKQSEAAMNEAKLKGMNQALSYSPVIADQLTKRMMIEKELRQAIKLESFVLHYQTQVMLSTNEVVGVEALIRWIHPTMGVISPANFIPIAEETGLIIPLGEWVLRTACEQIKQWEEEGMPSIRLSVNLSSVQLRQKNLVEKIKEIIEETRIDPTKLVLEVTESTLVNHMQYTINQLRDLKSLGIQVALDDFGTLYSSLNYLKHFPLDIIKIDRSFVHTLLSDSKDIEIVNTIIRLGKNLKLKVLAEGIETKGQAQLLQQHDCHEGQGFLFSKPVPMSLLKQATKV